MTCVLSYIDICSWLTRKIYRKMMFFFSVWAGCHGIIFKCTRIEQIRDVGKIWRSGKLGHLYENLPMHRRNTKQNQKLPIRDWYSLCHGWNWYIICLYDGLSARSCKTTKLSVEWSMENWRWTGSVSSVLLAHFTKLQKPTDFK